MILTSCSSTQLIQDTPFCNALLSIQLESTQVHWPNHFAYFKVQPFIISIRLLQLLSLSLFFSIVCPLMDRRKEELEKKRQKLAELRRAREERRALLESQSTHSSSVTLTYSSSPETLILF